MSDSCKDKPLLERESMKMFLFMGKQTNKENCKCKVCYKVHYFPDVCHRHYKWCCICNKCLGLDMDIEEFDQSRMNKLVWSLEENAALIKMWRDALRSDVLECLNKFKECLDFQDSGFGDKILVINDEDFIEIWNKVFGVLPEGLNKK